ncbi:MAG: glycerophosphodiester phosphodiesterase family protein [Bacteroidota bacterium]|nr:glycerophosphodiester phosphodiesterase family protein [Bacteroidota bacterium]
MKTKKIIEVILCVILCCPMMGWANGKIELTGLDNYTIPLNKKGALIGKVIPQQNGQITLLKDTAGIFRIDKSGCIRLKRNVKLTSSTPAFRYGITIETEGKTTELELVKDEFIHNKVVAHRGAWKNHDASENSLSALKNAIEIGCEGSEFDVWLSADSALIISHDPKIGGKQVEKTTREELKKISLKNNDYVPELKDFLLTINKQNKTRLFLEVKPSQLGKERSIALTDMVVKMVHDLKVQAWVNYISFSYPVLQRIQELDPAAKTAFLSDSKKIEEIKADKLWGIDYPFTAFKNDKDLIKNSHKLGLSVNIWTVNDSKDLKLYLDEGADLITTNEPEMLLQMVKKE